MLKKLLILFLLISQSKAINYIEKLRYSISNEKDRYVLDFKKNIKKKYIKLKKRKTYFCFYIRRAKLSSKFPKAKYFYSSKIVKKIKVYRRYNPKICFFLKRKDYILNYFTYKNKLVVDLFRKDIEAKKTRERRKYAKKLKKEKKFIVVLDPGHGGFDSGAVWPIKSYHPYLKEKDIVLKFAKLIKKYLEKYGNVKVILTRKKDKYVSLYERSKIAADYGADLFVSLHVDSYPRSYKISGITIYIASPKYKKYSQKMVRVFYTAPRPIKVVFEKLAPDITYSFSDDLAYNLKRYIKRVYKGKVKVKRHNKNIVVLRTPGRPSVLIELGFITSRYDRRFYTDKRKMKKLAKAIAQGIYAYLRRFYHQKTCYTKKLVYQVKKGDTLWKIAQKFNVSIFKIKSWNNLKSYILHSGEKLYIYKKVCD